MLTRTGTGRRRLFRPGDAEHPERRGRIIFSTGMKPNASAPKEQAGASKSRGASAETLMKLMGRISREDADEIIRIIDDCCGRVDANEW